MHCFVNGTNLTVNDVHLSLYLADEEDVQAAVHLTVHLAGGGVAVQTGIKEGVIGHTGHAAEIRGTTLVFFFFFHLN